MTFRCYYFLYSFIDGTKQSVDFDHNYNNRLNTHYSIIIIYMYTYCKKIEKKKV